MSPRRYYRVQNAAWPACASVEPVCWLEGQVWPWLRKLGETDQLAFLVVTNRNTETALASRDRKGAYQKVNGFLNRQRV